ncbi:MAG: RNA polymerase sigma factor [Tetrasphaera sp.]|jgi:RNA polymerase sigma factor (sigma-70 family)|nr:RNA polymerase sigma factor [Tetrasphaera sp.]
MDDVRFEEMFRRCAPRVYAYARRHIDPADCDDVVADTFLAAWQRGSSLPEDPLPWLIVTARNTIANRTRGRRRADALWRDAVATFWHEPRTAQPDDVVVDRATLIDALGQCTEAEREALLLTAWDGLSYAEAARVLGCSERALTVRISRGRARLTSYLQPAARPDATPSTLRLVKDLP